MQFWSLMFVRLYPSVRLDYPYNTCFITKVKVKLSRYKSWRLKRGNVMLCFQSHSDIRHNLDDRAVSCTRRSLFAAKEIGWCSFLFEAEWSPGLLNADRRIGTQQEIEFGTSCFVARCLDHLRHVSTRFITSVCKKYNRLLSVQLYCLL